jgi:hypothetical protein
MAPDGNGSLVLLPRLLDGVEYLLDARIVSGLRASMARNRMLTLR